MMLTYKKNWKKHFFDVLALAELQKETYTGYYTTVSNFSTDKFGYNNLQAGALRLWEGTNSYYDQPRPAMEHISNNHEGLSKEQVVDLMRVNDGVERIFEKINGMLRTKDFSELDEVLRMRDELFGRIAEAVKSQLRRLRDEPGGGTRASMLYLTILNETRTMVLQARNLLKSQRYLLDHRASA